MDGHMLTGKADVSKVDELFIKQLLCTIVNGLHVINKSIILDVGLVKCMLNLFCMCSFTTSSLNL